MAAVLLVAGTLICAVSMLSPERLTPLALNVANKVLDADVKASRVELGLKATSLACCQAMEYYLSLGCKNRLFYLNH